MDTYTGTLEFKTEVSPGLIDKLFGAVRCEYVVENPVIIEGKIDTGEVVRYPSAIRERVVRCRDCKYAMEHRSKSILGTELVTLTCSGPIQGAYSEGADVEPDGFCAWGEPREVD